MKYPSLVLNWINDQEIKTKQFFTKINPDNGQALGKVANSTQDDVNLAIKHAKQAFEVWKNTPVIKRANILRQATLLIEQKQTELARIVHLETGKSIKDALSEIDGVVELGFFMASEGRRFYGKTTTSSQQNRFVYTQRAPVGIAALIIAANTPAANVAWKVFPSLLCGNASVLKPSEDAPLTALWFGKIFRQAKLPKGVFQIIQGDSQAGKALVEHQDIDLVSFTGSLEVGKFIQSVAGSRLAKVCLELGGKNALIVCDDADIDKAVQDTLLSAFSNAGQRCSSASRIIIFEQNYETFKKKLIFATKKLKLGTKDSDDLGPVINQTQLNQMLQTINQAIKKDQAKLLIGGKKLADRMHKNGYYLSPTILEGVLPASEISQKELFGPITCLYKVKNLKGALNLANNSKFGLTASIHTSSIHKAESFKNQIQAGVISINGPTYGAEPHLGFGGIKGSGNGFREPGSESLDIYCELKTVYFKHFPELA